MGDDERLRGLADQIDAELRDAPAAMADLPAPTAEAGRRRRVPRSWRRLALGIGAAVLVLVLAVVALSRDKDPAPRASTPGATDEPAAPGAPPPVKRTDPHLWLSAEKVPEAGGDLGVVLIDPDGDFGIYGVGAKLDRWADDRWTDPESVALCTAAWACAGDATPAKPEIQQDIGLYAVDGTGPLLWLNVNDLEPGWYRLRTTNEDNDIAAGQFEVVEGGGGLARLEPTRTPAIWLQPAVLPATTDEMVAAVVVIDDGADALVEGDLVGAPTRVERWTDGAWATVDGASAFITAGRPEGGDGATLLVSKLTPGTYRVVVAVGDERLPGALWVVEDSDL